MGEHFTIFRPLWMMHTRSNPWSELFPWEIKCIVLGWSYGENSVPARRQATEAGHLPSRVDPDVADAPSLGAHQLGAMDAK